MNRADVIELIKEYLSIEVNKAYVGNMAFEVTYTICLKFDGEVISSVELE